MLSPMLWSILDTSNGSWCIGIKGEMSGTAGRPIHAHDGHEGRRPKVDRWGRNGASQLTSLIWVLHFSKNLSFSDSSGDSLRYHWLDSFIFQCVIISQSIIFSYTMYLSCYPDIFAGELIDWLLSLQSSDDCQLDLNRGPIVHQWPGHPSQTVDYYKPFTHFILAQNCIVNIDKKKNLYFWP